MHVIMLNVHGFCYFLCSREFCVHNYAYCSWMLSVLAFRTISIMALWHGILTVIVE